MSGAWWRRAWGNAVVLLALRQQRGMAFAPVERAWAARDRRVRAVVRYAAATVPFYREWFRSAGLDPRDVRGTPDLAQLPLIDKATVARDPRAFVSTSSRGRTAEPFVTSGSTRRRLEVWHDRRSLLANIAYGEREKTVVRRFVPGGPFYRELHIRGRDSAVNRAWAFQEAWTLLPARARRIQLPLTTPVEEVVRVMNHTRPQVMRGYGSYLEWLFRTIAARRWDVHRPSLLVFGADSPSSGGVEFIEGHFGIPVIGRYNAVECFRLGYQCERRSGYHVYGDLCHVRIVTAAGMPAVAGEEGEVVVSNLVNHGTVLLNYRLGDLAALSDVPCPCGRSGPVLTSLVGRVEDLVRLRDGSVVHAGTIAELFRRHAEIQQFQLIQHDDERFVLKLVTAEEATYRRIVPGIVGSLRVLLGGDVDIGPIHCDVIERPASGKLRPVVSLVGRPAVEAAPGGLDDEATDLPRAD